MKKNKKGVSLIILVITIIVMIILASVVVMGLNDNNPIEKANESLFKSDISEFNHQLSIKYIDEKIEDRKFKSDNINLSGEAMEEYVANIKPTYYERLEIISGELVYVGDDEREKKWAEEVGLTVSNPTPTPTPTPTPDPTPDPDPDPTPDPTPDPDPDPTPDPNVSQEVDLTDETLFNDKFLTVAGEQIEVKGNLTTMKIAQYGENLDIGTVVRANDNNYYFTITYSQRITEDTRETFHTASCMKLNLGRLVVPGVTPDIKAGDIKKVGNKYYAARPYSYEDKWFNRNDYWVELKK